MRTNPTGPRTPTAIGRTGRRFPISQAALTLLLCLSIQSVTATAQTIKQLFSFPCDNTEAGLCPDGGEPNHIIQASDGNFYGVTGYSATGTQSNGGTVFKITPTGQFTHLISFHPDGNGNTINPATALLEANDGFIYATTYDGGGSNNGVLFKISKSGTGFQVVHSFCAAVNCSDGILTYDLTLGHDGNLYGVTLFGGSASCGCGTIFRYSTATGTFTTLFQFQTAVGGNLSSIIQGSDGHFYLLSGRQVIRFTPPSTITGLATIPFQGFDPCNPATKLLQIANSELFSALGCDQIEQVQFFKVSPAGQGFQEFPQQGHLTEVPALMQASDGNLWDTLYDLNSVVAISPATGTIIKKFVFNGTNGGSPESSVVQAPDGKLYGTATSGGTVSGGLQATGTVWVLNAGLPPPLPQLAAFMPTSGLVGTKVLIRGDHFIGTKAVSFDGVNAAFRVLNRNFISATVPVGATSGAIAVTNPGGKTVSAGLFIVK